MGLLIKYMHYKIAMKHQITNKIKLICVCLLLPLIALGQKNQNAQLANEFLKNGFYSKASELYSDLYNTYRSTNYYQGLIECYFSMNQIDTILHSLLSRRQNIQRAKLTTHCRSSEEPG